MFRPTDPQTSMLECQTGQQTDRAQDFSKRLRLLGGTAFGSDDAVVIWESYPLMARLLDEQCEMVEPADDAPAPIEVDSATTAGLQTDEDSTRTGDDAVVVEAQQSQDGDTPCTEPVVPAKEEDDADATYGRKDKGYEVQIAETCEESNAYQIITAVAVNGANASDQHATVPMVELLSAHGFLPDVLLDDTGYGSGENIVQCVRRGVELYAPVPDPEAPTPKDYWAGAVESRGPALAPVDHEVRDVPIPCRATFDADRCSTCPLADRCPTRQLEGGQRVLRWKPAKAATATRQHQQRQAPFKEGYKIRSGVESTDAEFKGRHGAKKLRVRGEQRVAMMIRLKATALDVKRAVQHHTARLAGRIEPERSEAIAYSVRPAPPTVDHPAMRPAQSPQRST